MSSHRSTIRVLAYSHDSYGLGHLRRSLSVVSAMIRRDARVQALCVTGSPMPDLFELPRHCDIVKLPCITKDAAGGYRSRSLAMSLQEVVALRSELILASVRSFRPHLVLVDHAATGPGAELLPALRRFRHALLDTRVVLGMRDVIDAPHRVRAQMSAQRTLQVLRDDYDEILVYGDPRVLDVATAYELPDDIRAKTTYVGFACRPTPVTAPVSGPLRILASAGGGADGYRVLRGVVAALRGPLADDSLRATVVAGPLMDVDEVEALRLAARGDARIEILAATREMPRLIGEADLVVGMGGYNSVYEALANQRRLLVWPRSQPRLEQLERARRLAALGLVGIVEDDVVTDPVALAAQIRAALGSPRPDPVAAGLGFDGADRAAERLLDSLEPARQVRAELAARSG